MTTSLRPAARARAIGAGEWLRLSAARFPDRSCFVDETAGTDHSFAETNTRVNRLADALAREGVGVATPITLLATDSHRYMEVLLASMKLGACYVPLNYRLAPFEVQNLVRAARSEWIFVSARYVELARGLVGPDGGPMRVVCFDDLDGADGTDAATDGGANVPITSYEEFLAGGSDVEPEVPVDDDLILGLAFTSGTTGLPKGVMQSQRMVKAFVTNMMIDYGIGHDECRYSAAPMFHISGMGMIFMGVLRGYPNVIAEQFDPAQVQRWLAEQRLTGCFMVPTMLSSLLAVPGVADHDYSALGSIIYGAAPMPPALLRRAMQVFDCDFVQAFGAGTEAGLQTVLTPADHRRAIAGAEHLLGSIGRPCTGVDLRICDDDLVDVPRGVVGEIVTRSDTVMSGYLENPEATSQSLVNGWFRAGDQAWQDEEGYLYLAGRKKDMIIRGGENVYPIEIESVLSEHPAVAEVAIVGVPDEHWGELVRACVVQVPGTDRPDDAELAGWCRSKLAAYKVPAEFVWLGELPKNASGKILKRELRPA